MTRQGRILIVDDSEQWREELVEILQRDGFYADAVSKAAKALEWLSETIYHVVVIDIRMNDADRSNIDGITLLQELAKRGLNEATKVIMLSAFGTKEQTRTAFREYDVADFLFKQEFKTQEFLKSVRQVFSEKVNINPTLGIHWQQENGLEDAVLNLEVDGSSVKHSSLLHNQLTGELEDLLCRLFYSAQNIMVQLLPPGQSGTGVLQVQPFYATGGGNAVIVKFGGVDKIEHEYYNFKHYVQSFIGGGRHTTVLDVRRTLHLGGIIYSLLGTTYDQLTDFGQFYCYADIPQIKDTLNRLFWDTCRAWYANRGNLQPLDLAADYQRGLSYTPEMLEQICSSQLTSVQGRHKLYFKSLKGDRAFTNPILATAGKPLVRPTYKCTTHGDFNHRNLLVDTTGHIWLIDFQGTDQSHILRDVATLDSAVRFQLLAADEATLEERLQMEEVFCTITNFHQLEQLPTVLPMQNQALAKAYATVMHLRTLARALVAQNSDNDMSEYYIALLYVALNTLRFSSLQPVQHEHALLCASLLADRLGLDSIPSDVRIARPQMHVQ